MSYRIGIDPGKRYIGLAIARIDEPDGPALPVHLMVIDLGHGQNALSSLLKGRAAHRRARRTRKSAEARIRAIRAVLTRECVPQEQLERVVALCRRRGWQPSYGDREPERNSRSSLRKKQNESQNETGGDLRAPRATVITNLQTLIPQAAPDLSGSGLRSILDILNEQPKGHGLDNRLVGVCTIRNCCFKRARGVDYPVLWLANGILTQLGGRAAAAVREMIIRELSLSGRNVVGMGIEAFRCKGQSKRAQADYDRVRRAWRKAAEMIDQPIPEGIRDNVERLLEAARKQLKGQAGPTRLAQCPTHLHGRVRELARGQVPEQGEGSRPGHSLVWENVAAKLKSYLRDRLPQILPPGAQVKEVAVERAAFDLLRVRGGREIPEDRVNDARWLGPYGQIRKLYEKEHPTASRDLVLLSFEMGGLCALCGKPLVGPVDRAHLIPHDEVGGYPYIAIVAAHPACNVSMGSRQARIAPEALEAFRLIRERLMRQDGFVHSWIDAKYGILHALANNADVERGPVPVDRYLRQVFTTAEATMQGMDRLGEAVQAAVHKAGFGSPEVRKRSASEVAGARWAALTDEGNIDPWFIKPTDKAKGSVLNHAIDAFAVAALPDAQPVGFRRGTVLWGVDPSRVSQRLAVLSSEEIWEAAAGPGIWARGKPQAINVMSLTLRRVWRQAYARDTKIRENFKGKGRGAYRKGAESWLSDLRLKQSEQAMLDYISNLQFEPLRKVALAALAPALATRKEAGEKGAGVSGAVRRAVVTYLKASTIRGLQSEQPIPTAGHPVREERVRRLREWAENPDLDGPVPPWVSVTIREDRFGGGSPRRLRVTQGAMNLETWVYIWVLGVHQDGQTALFRVEPDGALSRVLGPDRPVDHKPLLAAVQVSGVTALGPSLHLWRNAVSASLRAAGFSAAWVVGQGSEILTRDGESILFSRDDDEKLSDYLASPEWKQKLAKAAGVRRGGIRLFTWPGSVDMVRI